jgi:Sortase domain
LAASAGTVLIAGHVNLNGVQGAFSKLSRIEPGADIWVTDDRGAVTHWRVYANPVVPKDSPAWPVDVFDATGPRRLVLASCTGTLHLVAGYGYSYDDNQFVYAAPSPFAT